MDKGNRREQRMKVKGQMKGYERLTSWEGKPY